MKILLVGDIHLGKGLSIGKTNALGEMNSRNKDKVELLNWILEKVEDHQVDRVVLMGDIFDDLKPDYILLQVLIDFLKKLEFYAKKIINVDIIYGNHDIKRIGDVYLSILDLINTYDFKYIHLHKRISNLEVDGVNLCFVPFRDKRSFGKETHAEALEELRKRIDELKKEESINLLFGHLTLEGALYVGDEIDDQANELMCPPAMFDGFKHVWMGHIHKPQELTPNVSHIGSLDISDFGEVNHEKYLLLYDTKKDKSQKINVPTRPLRVLEINIPDETEEEEFIKTSLKAQTDDKAITDAIVKIEIWAKDLSKINRKEIEKIVYDLGAFHISHFITHKQSAEIISIEKKTLMTGISEPNQAIQTVIEQSNKYTEEDFKKELSALCLSIMKEYKDQKGSDAA